MMATATISSEFYERIYALAESYAEDASLAADGVHTIASRTPVPIDYAPDIITMGPLVAGQTAATIGRGRDEEVRVVVVFSSFRTGDVEAAAKEAKDAVFALVNTMADYVRSEIRGDTTLGGTVSWCFLEDLTADYVEIAEPAGVLWEAEATFAAQYRVRG